MISVVVPIYNSSKYLKECIESILNQTFTDFELLLIDDGSSDNSVQICQLFNDKRIHLFCRKHKGVSETRNFGIKKSKGKYICFIDSDDVIDSNYLSILYSNMNDDIDFVECNFIYLGENYKKNRLEKMDILSKKDMFLRLYSENGIRTCIIVNKLFQRKLFDDLKFENVCNEDEFIIHKLLSKVNKVKVLSDVLYFYRIQDNSRQRIISEENIYYLNVFDERKQYFKDKDFLILNERTYFNQIIYLYCVFYKHKQFDSMEKLFNLFKENIYYEKKFGVKNNFKFFVFLKFPKIIGKIMLLNRRYKYA